MENKKQSLILGLLIAFLLLVGYQTVSLAILSAKFADMPLVTGVANAKVFGTSVELPDMAGGC